MRLAAAILALATPVAAQDLVYSDEHTRNCVNTAADSPGRLACIGRSADACMSGSTMGGSTIGMGGCLDREREFWDGVLNANYVRAMDKARAMDAANAGTNVQLASVAQSLKDTQRAWIAFRDATCDYEMAQWGGGTGGSPALIACLMRETGEQALYLFDSWNSQ